MASGRQRFKISFTFSFNNILYIIADHLSKKALLASYPFHASKISLDRTESRTTSPAVEKSSALLL
jgi:hypothetical protein